MRLPGPLIEYLINGSIAMIWIFPFIQPKLCYYKEALIILIPIIYVIGMFIDLLAFGLTKFFKQKLRMLVEKRYMGTTNDYFPGIGKEMKIKILTKYPELAKEIETRSGRDRIARGMIINSIFFLIFSENLPFEFELSLILLIMSIIMWVAFEYASHGFIIRAYDATKKEKVKK